MERWTKRTADGVLLSEDHEEKYTPIELIDILLERLAAYEDTELTPEICANYKKFEDEAISKGVTFNRIVELMEAERAGRLMVLPCKAGDTLYFVDGDKGGDFVDEYKVEYFYASSSGINRIYCTGVPYPKNFRPKQIGKTVFLNREDAEAALKGLQEAHNEA